MTEQGHITLKATIRTDPPAEDFDPNEVRDQWRDDMLRLADATEQKAVTSTSHKSTAVVQVARFEC